VINECVHLITGVHVYL